VIVPWRITAASSGTISGGRGPEAGASWLGKPWPLHLPGWTRRRRTAAATPRVSAPPRTQLLGSWLLTHVCVGNVVATLVNRVARRAQIDRVNGCTLSASIKG